MRHVRNRIKNVPKRLNIVKGRTYPIEFKNNSDVITFWYVGRKLLPAGKVILDTTNIENGMYDFDKYVRKNIARPLPALSRRNGIIQAVRHGLSTIIYKQGLRHHKNLCRFRVKEKVKKPKEVVAEISDGVDMGGDVPPPPPDNDGGGGGGPPEETSKSVDDIEVPRQPSLEQGATQPQFDFSFRVTNGDQQEPSVQIPEPEPVSQTPDPDPVPQVPETEPGPVPKESAPGSVPTGPPAPEPMISTEPPVEPGPLPPAGRPKRRRPPRTAEPVVDQVPQRIQPIMDRNPFIKNYGRRRFQRPTQAPIQIPPEQPPRIQELGQLQDRAPFYGQLHRRTTESLRSRNIVQQLLDKYGDEESEDDLDFEEIDDVERVRRSVAKTVPPPVHSTPRPGAVVPPHPTGFNDHIETVLPDPPVPDEPPIVPATAEVVQPSTGVTAAATAEPSAPHLDFDEHVDDHVPTADPRQEPRQEPKDTGQELLNELKEHAKNYSDRYRFSYTAPIDSTSRRDAGILLLSLTRMAKDKLIHLEQFEPYGDIFIDFIE